MNEARLTIWDDAACKRVHDATLEILVETGIEVRYAPAVEVFAKAGADVDGTRVRIPAKLVDAALACAPRDATIKPRGGETGAARAGRAPQLLRHRQRRPVRL